MTVFPRNTGLVFALAQLVVLALASPPTPHIVFVMVDDLGYNDVGYHSDGSAIETDNIDALAAGGLKLESYYVAPLCTPSRSQFLSGKYLIHNGMQHLVIDPRVPRCLPLGDDTMANKLTDAGYATHLVGKWHLGFYKQECWPLNRGFQSFFGMLLGQSTVDQGGTKPMFMYLSYQAPHLPFEVPDEYFVSYRGKINNRNRRTYAGMVTMLDESIGKLTDTLKEEGLWNDTVFIFSTDNGGVGKKNAGNNWPLRGVKGNYFEGGIRGVGFVAGPLLSTNVQGTISTDLMHISDWYPTLVEGVAKVTLNHTELGLDGVNMWDVISQGESGDPDREIVYNIDPDMQRPASIDSKYDSYSTIFDISIHASIRRGDMKLVTGYQADTDWLAPVESGFANVYATDAGKAIWLYNITADPTEQDDLSDTMADEVVDLLGRLQSYYTGSRFEAPANPGIDCDSDPALHGDLWTNWE
eukprot:XP_011665315.1 PREDICTED: arylsulfatase B [Strongylocentrotus purpuratus]